MNIQILDLKGKYQKIKKAISKSITKCLDNAIEILNYITNEIIVFFKN